MVKLQELEIKVKFLPHFEGIAHPQYHSHGASGIDLMAACQEPVVLESGERRLIPTGMIMEVPQGFEAQIRPRSGLALRHGIILPNSPGTIDSDYRGEVQVILMNLGNEKMWIG